MRFVRMLISAVVLLAVGESVLVGQATDTRALENRFGALEETVRALEQQVVELSTMLRAALPPSPITDVPSLNLGVRDAAAQGSPDSKVVLVELSDFECPFCGQYAQMTYPELRRQFVETGKIRYVFRNLPLEEIHPRASKAEEVAECARAQGKFWEMHDRIFANQRALGVPELESHAQALGLDLARFQSCLADGKAGTRIKEDLVEAKRLGLTGTPAFLIGEFQADGSVRITRRITGAQPFQVFQAALE